MGILNSVRVLYNASLLTEQQAFMKFKAKAVPLHATKALGGRGNITLTHSRSRHQMGVSGQRHAPAAL
jgi:hypothetical protein